MKSKHKMTHSDGPHINLSDDRYCSNKRAMPD